jgi:hypothetical protein
MSDVEPRAQDPAQAPGAIPLRVRNIAPHEGDREVGLIPFGLSAIVAENEEGKSRILSAVTAIPLEVKKPEELITINRGQMEAGVGLGTAEIMLRLVPVGERTKTRTTRQASAAEGPIHHLPDPITMLITGGDNVTAAVNWRNRMKALSEYVAFDADEERLTKLAGLLPAPDDDIAAELLERHSAQPYPDLLAAADALADGRHGILHVRKRDAKEQAAALGSDIERQIGRMEEILRRAARDSGLPPDAELRRILLDATAAGEPERLRGLEAALATLTLRASERERTARERAALAESLGDRPTLDAEQSRVMAAQRAVEEAERSTGAAQERAAAARRRLEELGPQVSQAQEAILTRRSQWDAATGLLDETFGAGRDGWPSDEAIQRAAAVATSLEALQGAILAGQGIRDQHARAVDTVTAEDQAADELDEGLRAMRRQLEDAEGDLAAARERLDGWVRTDAQLRAALPPLFPDVSDLEPWEDILVEAEREGRLVEQGTAIDVASVLQRATAKVEALRPRARAAASGEIFRQADTERQRLVDAQQDALDRAERLEADAVAVWDRLAEIISSMLQSDFLRVGPRRLEVRLDSGRWVDVADDVELSKGRLRRAMLDFYLERVEPGERNVVIDDSVMLPIGQEGREELSRRAAAKRIRLMFEQPRLGTEARDVHVIWYGGAAPQEASAS